MIDFLEKYKDKFTYATGVRVYLKVHLKSKPKSEVKIYEKVISQLPEVRPLYLMRLLAKTEDKESNTARVICDIIDICQYFGDFTFFKNGFSIGDQVHVAGYFDKGLSYATIAEIDYVGGQHVAWFIEAGVCQYCLPLHLLYKEEKVDDDFELPKFEDIFRKVNITKVTSRIKTFVEEYFGGIYDFNPRYQRDLVWTLEQKQAFIEAVLTGQAKLQATLIYLETPRGKVDYEVLDGKQRLNTVIEYISGNFEVYGRKFADLPMKLRDQFLKTKFEYDQVKYYGGEMPEDLKIELFLQINDYGQRVSDEHLDKIKREYLGRA